jgi:uncharacterized protein
MHMGRDETITILKSHSAEIRERFGVKRLAVFGSIARNEASDDSDVDVLVEFRDKATFKGYMALKFHLEDLLGRPVDLVTQKAIRPVTRPSIERDLVDVA